MKCVPKESDPAETETGFGLIEVLVSLMLLAILAIAMLPIIIGSLKAAQLNATVSTATQLLSQQIEELRSRDSTCAALTDYATETIAPVVDRRGVTLQALRESVVCPGTYPGTARVTISVVISGASDPVASAVSLVFVKTA